MPTVKATPLPGAMTRKEAQAAGLVEFLSMAICRKAGCDTFVREARTLRCVACRERDAPKEAAKAEKDRAKAAQARKQAAAARKRRDAQDLKEAQKAAARKARSDARELVSPTAVIEPPMFGVLEPATGG